MADVLVLAREPPHPPDAGDRIVTRGILHALAERGHEPHLLTYADPGVGDRLDALRDVCATVSTVPGRAAGAPEHVPARMRKLARALAGRSDVMAMFASEAFEVAVRERVAELEPSVVLAEHPYMGQAFRREDVGEAMQAAGAEAVVNAHVVEHAAHRRRLAEHDAGGFEAFWLQREIRNLRAEEEAVYAAADRVLVLGEADRERLQGVPTPVAVQRVGLALDRYTPWRPTGGRPEVAFFGSYDWFPNEQGILRFADEVWPRVREQVPEARLLAAGRQATDAVRGLDEREGIAFLGEVDDLEALVHRASLVAAPIWVGGGARIKVLEAMAWGAPVAATRTALEGVRCVPGEDVVGAEQPGELADAIAQALSDGKRRTELGRRARQRIREEHSLDAMGEQLAANLALGDGASEGGEGT